MDVLYGCAINDSGFIYVTGGSYSTTGIASPQGYRSIITGPSDVILAKLDSNGQRIWGTYYGGLSWDGGNTVELDSDGNIYMCGDGYSENNTDNKVFPCTRKRLRLYAVRDCGLLSCPPTRKFMRGRMLELPLKPLLHIAFVSVSLFIFLVIFLSFLLHLFCLPCVRVDKLFCRFWS
ncbi:MAG: hypothetical protein NT004_02495 [Bacteroidetes bacterium]|nr:hypothetical protein [Bacteroidota bacterium]